MRPSHFFKKILRIMAAQGRTDLDLAVTNVNILFDETFETDRVDGDLSEISKPVLFMTDFLELVSPGHLYVSG